MRIVFMLLCLFFSISVNAQNKVTLNKKKKGERFINVNFTPQWYINKVGVFNDGIYPDNISAKNTMGYIIGAEYQYISNKKWTLQAGLNYGSVKHDVTVNYKSLDFFDPSNAAFLSQFNNKTNYAERSGYFSLKLAIGYMLPITETLFKGCIVEGNAGASIRIWLKGRSESVLWRAQYQKNDSIFLGHFGADVANFGGYSGPGSFWSSIAWSNTMDLYIGLSKPINESFIKKFSVGVAFTYALGGKYKSLGDVSSVSYNYLSKPISLDEYRAQDFSIGIRFAAGLWK